ncbi:hypothetical protein [Sphingomonas montanisoli]|uniref:Uncharacterized protein n=1 Tax=Sphingomonas montanisoli TaxID=2606412 RepID=A0A5D9C821_9SPHN|nr:hypothetical protein [Sphingomonas montanisoli]TZG27272.1 hypothetical protein FYJ91_06530 [Sphingomonas montanisoli]
MKIAPLLAALAATSFANPAQAVLVDGYSAQLAKLPEIRKRAVIRRAILDNEAACQQVTMVKLQGRWKNLTMWSARCTKGGDYGVFIGPDGTAQVRACTDIAKLKTLPACQLPKP